MTKTELDKLDPEQKKIRIAELYGWKLETDGWWFHPKHARVPTSGLPDYLEDLNAMHEVWLHLCKDLTLNGEGDRDTYGDYLYRASIIQTHKNGGSVFYTLANLSATQRADAFLLAFG